MTRAGVSEVVRELADARVEVCASRGFDRFADTAMESPVPARPQIGGDGLGDQGVPEPEPIVADVGHQARHERRIEHVEQVVGVEAGRLAEDVEIELAADHRRDTQHRLEVVGKPADRRRTTSPTAVGISVVPRSSVRRCSLSNRRTSSVTKNGLPSVR